VTTDPRGAERATRPSPFPWELALLRTMGVALFVVTAALAWPATGLAGRPGVRAASLAVEAVLVAYALVAFRTRVLDAALRRAWLRVIAAFGVWLLSDLVWFALGSPPLSVADVGYTAFFPLVLWGVLSFPTREARGRTRFWLDSGIVVTAGATLVWYFLLAPVAESGFEATLSGIVNLGYPVGDVVLLFGACALLLREPLAGGRAALWWIAMATIARFAGDLLYGISSLDGSYVSGSAIDELWVLGYWSVAMAIASHRRQAKLAAGSAAPVQGSRRGPSTLVPALLPYIALVAAFATLVHATMQAVPGGSLRLSGVLAGTAIVLALIAARQMQAMRENAILEHERATRAGDERLSALVRHSSDALLVVASDGVVRFASPATQAVFGLSPDRLVGHALTGVVRTENETDVEGLLASAREAGSARAVWRLHSATQGEAAQHPADTPPPERFAEVVGTDLRHEPSVDGLVLNIRDVTERTALEAQLTYLAFHDPLTGLVNRTRLRDRAAAALGREVAPGGLAVLFVDLDDFKLVNDSLGHEAGDRLLSEMASRLLSATRGCDAVARLGGDEFAVLLEGVSSERHALIVADRIVEAASRPVLLDGTEVYVRASVGVALSEPDVDVDALLRRADVAMYEAKRAGKGRHALYSPSMDEGLSDQLALEADLHRAIERGELRLEYQPIVQLESGRAVGAEALMRWEHPQRGRIAPMDFIPMAEQSGLIVTIGRWALREACHQAAMWSRTLEEAGDDGAAAAFYMSVNVSTRQLDSPDLVSHVAEALAESGLDPSRLLLELTESAILRDTDDVLTTLQRLKALGVRLAIDDFGTGYSSLSYLHRFPFDVLKIDRSFVTRLERGGSDAALSRAVIALGEALSLLTIAEGVESPGQQAQLQMLGCRLAQGFLFARPQPADRLTATLADRPAEGASTTAAAKPHDAAAQPAHALDAADAADAADESAEALPAVAA
jgi:diguanylate cyclase (GGDEF)-like protein/PAS domain S-box-containing protein